MIIAGTGHRPSKLGGYSETVQTRLINLAKCGLQYYKATTVITGMALGWDQALAHASIALKIPFWAYIPFEGQEQMWPRTSRDIFQYLRQSAAKIVICSPGGYAAHKMQHRNLRMIEDCDEILALWNGSPGGTANCICACTKPVHNMWSNWEKYK